MSAGEAIHVQFAAISGGSTEVETIAAQIRSDLATLEQALAPVVRTWTGEAASTYQRLQNQWNSAAQDIQRVTHEASAALATAHGNYTRTEQTNTGMWA